MIRTLAQITVKVDHTGEIRCVPEISMTYEAPPEQRLAMLDLLNKQGYALKNKVVAARDVVGIDANVDKLRNVCADTLEGAL